MAIRAQELEPYQSTPDTNPPEGSLVYFLSREEEKLKFSQIPQMPGLEPIPGFPSINQTCAILSLIRSRSIVSQQDNLDKAGEILNNPDCEGYVWRIKLVNHAPD